MPADLDTLVIALYVMGDELLGPRTGPGRRPKLSDADLVCLAVAQVLLGCDSERRWRCRWSFVAAPRPGRLYYSQRPAAGRRSPWAVAQQPDS